MSLVDRLDHTDSDPNRHIGNHEWSAAMWFFAKGSLTRPQVIALFGLDGPDQVQLDQLIAHYQGLSVNDKREFHSTLEAAGILLETGRITKAQYLTLLGMS